VTERSRVIFLDVPLHDMILAMRAVKWLVAQPITQRDSILAYGDDDATAKHFYVKRNKASITVRPC
jgi:hypothetical protein